MARTSTKTTPGEIPDELQQAIDLLSDDTFTGESMNPALQQLYTEMGVDDGEAQVHVTKLNSGANGSEAQIWKGSPEDYDLERLAKSFGSGEYRVKIYAKIATGQRVIKANRVFSWLLSPEDEEKRRNPGNVSNAPGITASDVARIVAETMKANAPPVSVAPPPDPFAMMERMSIIMANMRPESQHAPQTDPFTIVERVISLQNQMRESMPERDDGPAPSNANTNDLLLGLIKNFGPMFAKVLMDNQAPQNMEQQTNDAAPQLTNNPQPVATPAPVTPPTDNQQGDDVNMKLRMGMNFLVMQCDAGGEAITYAEVVADSVPAETLQQLVNDPNAINVLIGLDKRIEEPTRKVWFETLLTELKKMFSDEGEDDGQAS